MTNLKKYLQIPKVRRESFTPQTSFCFGTFCYESTSETRLTARRRRRRGEGRGEEEEEEEDEKEEEDFM